ncbi:MAG: AbrB/MazE/SpoVT family DNA-binding domain-containing protein [Pseudomonadota bacterium]
MKLQVKKIGNSTGLILPKELVARLELEIGDYVHVSELPDGAMKMSAYDPHHYEVMEIARKLMHEYRDTFKALAE